MEFVHIPWDSRWYDQEIDLRNNLLRIPLGLSLTEEDRAAESDQLHFGMLQDECLVACAVIVLVTESNVKLRQMAVEPGFQGSGVGTDLIRSIERVLLERGIQRIELNARETAVAFYQRLGYQSQGETFIEVTLPHRKMTKSLGGAGPPT